MNIFDKLRDEYDVPEDVLTELEESSALRKQIGDLKRENDRLKPFEQKVAKLEKAPKRQEIFEKYGVQFDDLRPAERKAIEAFDWEGDEPSEEAVLALIKEYELPVGEAENAGEPSQAEAIVNHGQNVGARKGGATTGVIKVEDAATWSTEKLLRFREQNPEGYESLKRGEDVHATFTE